jgi:hypothetical protein
MKQLSAFPGSLDVAVPLTSICEAPGVGLA